MTRLIFILVIWLVVASSAAQAETFQTSAGEVDAFTKIEGDRTRLIRGLEVLTRAVVSCTGLAEFEELMRAHERLLADFMGRPTVHEERFEDYPGTVKSLGAWGGDFVLATGTPEDRAYFIERGYPTVLGYHEMVR